MDDEIKRMCQEVPDPFRLQLYDGSIGSYRDITQEDINQLQEIEVKYTKLISHIEHQIDQDELYSDNSQSYEEIMERNKRLKWGAFA